MKTFTSWPSLSIRKYAPNRSKHSRNPTTAVPHSPYSMDSTGLLKSSSNSSSARNLVVSDELSTNSCSDHPGATWASRKRLLMQSSPATVFSILTAMSLTAYSSWYMWKEDSSTENQLESALKHLNSDDPEFISRGLKELQNCLRVKHVVFSGFLDVSAGQRMIDKHSLKVTNAFVHAIENSEYLSRWTALSWLYRLASGNHSVRSQLASNAHAIQLLANLASSLYPLENSKNEWFIASHILLLLARHQYTSSRVSHSQYLDSKPQAYQDPCLNPSLLNTIDKLASGQRIHSPLGLLLVNQLSDALKIPNPYDHLAGPLSDSLLSNSSKYITDPVVLESTVVCGSTLTSNFLFALLGSTWASMRWNIRAYLLHLRGSQTKKWLSTRKVGKPLFFAFLLDMFGQYLISFASSDSLQLDRAKIDQLQVVNQLYNCMPFSTSLPESCIKINTVLNDRLPQIVTENLSLASVMAVTQNTLFGLFSVWIIGTRRYAMLPLGLAFLYNHNFLNVEKMMQHPWNQFNNTNTN